MKRKNKIYIIALLIIIVSIIIVYYSRLVTSKDLYTNRFIVTKILSKYKYYQLYSDSTRSKSLKENYEKSINKILGLEGKINCIGERIKMLNDSQVIDLFVVLKRGSNTYLSFMKNINGVITEKELKISYLPPEFPVFCDVHYFYLHKSNAYMYDIYSLSLIENSEFKDVKVFFSPKFDNFLNVKSKCDTIIIDGLLNYIESSFNNSLELK